jgi:ribosomal protein S27AE
MTGRDSKRSKIVGAANYIVMNHQICPRCYKEMRVEVIAPPIFGGDRDQINYVCGGCGTQELQTVRR